jgi:membrane complex biogenesis BtpA family protein
MKVLGLEKPLVGMVHLIPLPGSPGYGGSFPAVIDRALADAEKLAAAGLDAIMVENFGDAPFTPGRIARETAAALAVTAREVRATSGLPVGINCLRSDGPTAVGVAVAAGAAFIRVNVHTGARLTDQGLIQGEADRTLRDRQRLGARDVAIWADVGVKHSRPLLDVPLAQEAEEAVERGRADALIVTGAQTGSAPDAAPFQELRAAVPDTSLVCGSGLDGEAGPALFALADAAIVGTALKEGGVTTAPVDPERARALVGRLRG